MPFEVTFQIWQGSSASGSGEPRKVVVDGSDFRSSQVAGIIGDAIPADPRELVIVAEFVIQ